MAKRTIVEITDDIDGSSAAEEIQFSYRGTDYTIDLSRKNATAFEKALKPYLAAATKVAKTRARTNSRPKGKAEDLAAIREWAAGAGIAVSSRGRISQAVLDQYRAANG